MSVSNITCDICGGPSKERSNRPLAVNLAPKTLPVLIGNPRFQKYVVQIQVSGSEYEKHKVPNYDAGGVRQQLDSVVDMMVKDPKDFDVCLKCLGKLVEQALEEIKTEVME